MRPISHTSHFFHFAYSFWSQIKNSLFFHRSHRRNTISVASTVDSFSFFFAFGRCTPSERRAPASITFAFCVSTVLRNCDKFSNWRKKTKIHNKKKMRATHRVRPGHSLYIARTHQFRNTACARQTIVSNRLLAWMRARARVCVCFISLYFFRGAAIGSHVISPFDILDDNLPTTHRTHDFCVQNATLCEPTNLNRTARQWVSERRVYFVVSVQKKKNFFFHSFFVHGFQTSQSCAHTATQWCDSAKQKRTRISINLHKLK